MTRSRSAASPRTAGRVSETSLSTVRARSPRLAERGGDDLFEVHLAHHRLEDAGLQAAHVEQVAHERVQSVGFVLDRAEELVDVGLAPGDVGLAQARRRGLDPGERSSQVVGNRLQERSAQFVGLTERGGGRGFRRETHPLAQRGQFARRTR